MKKDEKFLTLILGAAIVVAFLSYLLIISGIEEKTLPAVKSEPECGNGACEETEYCSTCPEDCQCSEGKYCSAELLACAAPVCGNGKCEYFETPEYCCQDCACWKKDELCDATTRKCEKVEAKIPDGEVETLIGKYYKDRGKKITETKILGTLVWEGRIGKEAMVNIESQDYFDLLLVSDSGTVTEIKKP